MKPLEWRAVKTLQAIQTLVKTGLDLDKVIGTVRALEDAAVQLHRELQEVVGYNAHIPNPYVKQLVLGYQAQVREILAGLPETSIAEATVFACPNSRLEALALVTATIKGLQDAVIRLNQEAINRENETMAEVINANAAVAAKTEVRKPTFLDRRFNDFSRAVLQAARDGKESVHLLGRDIPIKVDNKNLEHLLEVEVNGKRYSLVENLESKATLAADGILGQELIEAGIRNLARIMERKKRSKADKAYKEVKSLWGEYAKIAWSLKNGIVHNERIAKTTLGVVSASLKEGKVPQDQSEARKLGLKLPFISRDEWPFIRAFAARILARQAKPEPAPAPETPKTE